MKKRIMVLMLIIIMGLAGCAEKEEAKVEETKEESEQQKEEVVDQKGEPEEDNIVQENSEKKVVKVYIINPEDGSLTAEEKECEEITEQVIWDLLKDTGLIQAESKVISLSQEGEKLVLDVDSIFGEQLRSYGTAGEQELMSCVVNTYLDAYNCSGIRITEEGGILYSGHKEYADYISKFE